MSFRRSGMLSLIFFSTLFTLGSLPVRAQEGELAAQDPKAQVNLRALANVQAEILATGNVGDRIQILSTITSKDGQAWYRVKVLRTGQVGWVRGDLIKVLGGAKTASAPKAMPPATLKQPVTASKKLTASIPLIPPKSPTKSLALPQRAAGSAIATPPPKSAKTPVAQPASPAEAAAPPAETAIAAPSGVIVSFQTQTYAVRIFSAAGHLRLNLFNRKSQQLALDAVPVESKTSGEATVYSYGRDLKVTVAVPTQGTPTLTTVALGNTLQEKPETAPAAESTAPQ